MATFRGNEFFSYNLSQSPIQSSVDEITLSFRTLQRNGLLLHTGRSADYVNLSLRNGALWLVINLGSGAFEALVEPTSGRFNDNNWHDVRVTRNRRQVCPRCSECLENSTVRKNQSGFQTGRKVPPENWIKRLPPPGLILSGGGVFFWPAVVPNSFVVCQDVSPRLYLTLLSSCYSLHHSLP